MTRFASILVAAAWLSGCAATHPPAPATLAAPAETAYRIGPGDVIAVRVWGSPELSAEAPVRPDGRVTTPLIEDLDAVGKTPEALARDVETALTPYLRAPRATVKVARVAARNGQNVRVIGRLAQPLSLPYRQGMRLSDVMTAVGGLSPFANGDRAVLARRSGAGWTRYTIEIDRLIRDGEIDADRPLAPGDVIFIPERLL